MATLPHDPTQALKAVLSEPLPWHGARIGCLAHFRLALLKVRSVNLAELATGFGGPAKVASHYQRLQRCFRAFAIDQDALARLVVRLVPVGDGPWRLTVDRTNWQFGRTESNFLVLGVAHRGMAVPLFWSVLGKAGNSDTAERIALMERFIKVFGVSRVAALLADRECVGAAWCQWLQYPGLPFHQRRKRDTLVPNRWNRMMRLDRLFGSLRPGAARHLVGRRPVWGGCVHRSALRLDDGDCLFIASSGAPQAAAIDADADRWPVETRFGALTSRGFNLEDTHRTDPQRLAKLMGLLALAFAWTYRTGELRHDGPNPIRQKKRCRGPSRPSSVTDSTSFATPF
jgi:hypothetical protein